MNGPMQVLFQYTSEQLVRSFLSPTQERLFGRRLDALEESLLGTMTDAQKDLWDQWRGAETDYDLLYEQALFQAAFALARELG